MIVRQNFKKNKKLFNDIKKRLRTKLSEDIPINHVGSTAIPRMSGKNIIDILIGVEKQSLFSEITKEIIDLGYFQSKSSKTKEYQFFASRKEETQSGDIHIYLALLETERYNDFITLKNYLLKQPKEAQVYLKHKKEANKFSNKNRDEYKKIKSKFVDKLIKKARGEL